MNTSPADLASVDVGLPAIAGSAKRIGTGWDIMAGGADIWEKSDQFHFVYKPEAGDFDVVARIESFSPAHLYSKAGIMIRETLDADSSHLMLVAFAENAPRNNNLGIYEMQFRARTGKDCQAVYPAVRPPAPPEFPAAYPNTWLRLQRQGDQFHAFASTDGQSWKAYGTQKVSLARQLLVGPALTSHNVDAPARAAFRDYSQSAR